MRTATHVGPGGDIFHLHHYMPFRSILSIKSIFTKVGTSFHHHGSLLPRYVSHVIHGIPDLSCLTIILEGFFPLCRFRDLMGKPGNSRDIPKLAGNPFLLLCHLLRKHIALIYIQEGVLLYFP